MLLSPLVCGRQVAFIILNYRIRKVIQPDLLPGAVRKLAGDLLIIVGR